MRQVYIKWQFVLIVLLLCNCTSDKSTTYLNGKNLFQIRGDKYKLLIEPENFTFYFTDRQDHVIVPAHSYSGLTFSGSKVVSSEKIEAELNGDTRHLFLATNEIGEKAIVQITLEDGIASFKIKPQKEQFTKTSLSLGGMSVAHGLGDAGAYEESFNLITNKREEYSIENNGGQKRWASSFVIFPQNDVAGVFFGDGKKSVSINEHEYTMSITKKGEAIFYYFLGKPAQIYKSYKTIRNQEGFADIKPKFRLFELGWESWDALGWNTNQTTVKEILEKFHKKGYPIRWAVTGSGFWEAGGTTTNFGKWGNKFPNPETFKTWMHDHDIKWMIGLRTNFVPKGGPYIPISSKRDRNLKGNSYNGNLLSEEGIESNYFVKDISGDLVTVTSQWFPQVPCYLLDGDAPGAARWYQNKYLNWKVDGIKEDTMMDIDSLTSIYNKPITEIAREGGLVMARNGEFTSPGTLLRINDTGVGNLSQRIPINYFQYAASGFPNVYSDVAGIHNMHNVKDIDRSILHTWLLSLTSGLAVGAYPDKWPAEKQKYFKKAIDFHYSLAPYLYSAAIDNYETGYPFTLTPLTIAFPEDSQTADLSNFEWMIGESVLAAPLLKSNTGGKMDVYLPEGKWYDYETGEGYEGPVMLNDFHLSLDKVPCFIGGKGIIIERKTESLIARIYPVSNTTEMVFTYPNGEIKSRIELRKVNWKNVKVYDKTVNEKIPYNKVGSFIQFTLNEGHDYLIE